MRSAELGDSTPGNHTTNRRALGSRSAFAAGSLSGECDHFRVFSERFGNPEQTRSALKVVVGMARTETASCSPIGAGAVELVKPRRDVLALVRPPVWAGEVLLLVCLRDWIVSICAAK
jgi:hypothetical protein